MKVLVTGAKGNLGKAIIKYLELNNVAYYSYSHFQDLTLLEWDVIDIVINCAGVIPAPSLSYKDYIDGNVDFLNKLIPLAKDVYFVHFSTFSELYKNDQYQYSKMLGNSLLIANSDYFRKLDIFPLPTLEDSKLIEKISKAALNFEKPVVDRLAYNFMTYDAVGFYVVDRLLTNRNVPISKQFVRKDLYDEICKVVDKELIIEGELIDRALEIDGVFHVSKHLITNSGNF